jgi:hypothetical protein
MNSILQEENKEPNQTPDYNESELTYINNLRRRMEFARDERDKPREEFDGMTFTQYWYTNEQGANTYIKPKRNKAEITFQSGTLRTKMMGLCASLTSLNLQADISAFDENDVVINGLGQSMEDIVDKTKELELDEEKQMLRQYELLKQGTIFVEEIWNDKYTIYKEATKVFTGKFRSVYWKTVEEKDDGKPETRIIPAINVYLGSMYKYDIKEQPYIFTINRMSYMEGEQLYGGLENWKYVSRTPTSFISQNGFDKGNAWYDWTLTNPPDGEIEVAKIQDLPNNEYQIVINGIPMLPIGAPLPWGCYYNIAQQNLEPIRHDFAYGKSFIFKNKNLVYLFDEMTKMALLKTWKSFMPPMINNSGRVISQYAMMPGKMNMGIPEGALKPLIDRDTQGVTQSEYQMMSEVSRLIDQNTTSQTFTGMKEKGEQTATQIVELQRQARIMLGITILAATLLEKKLTYLRINNLLANWFDPIDKIFDAVRQILTNRYRVVSRKRMIGKKGLGMRFVVPVEEVYTPEQVMEQEDRMEKSLGMPVRMTLIRAKELKQADYIWLASVSAKEKKSSEMSKMMFQEMINQAMSLGLTLNPQYVEEQFADVWDKDPSKLFLQQEQPMPTEMGGNMAYQQSGVPQPANMPARGASSMQKPTVNQMSNDIKNKKLA